MYRRNLLIERWNPTRVDKWGTFYWANHKGKTHRYGDHPAIVYIDGTMIWCKNGMVHRSEDKPAIVCDGRAMSWFKNGSTYLPAPEIVDYWDCYYKEYFDNLKKETHSV